MHTWPDDAQAFPVVLQRNAFSPRLVARAADVWRAMQDIVVDASTAVGWPPARYAESGTMFVVRSMSTAHTREVSINEPLIGRTWVSRNRRDILFTREVRVLSGTALVATATQEWAYLTRSLTPAKPTPELYEAFKIHPGRPRVELTEPEHVKPGPMHRFEFNTWHTWMDPFGHINHPDYVEFCDEGTALVVGARGLGAQNLVPVSEEVNFRAAIPANAHVVVETRLKGHSGSTVILDHRILVDEKVCATATTHRRLLGDTGAQLIEALR